MTRNLILVALICCLAGINIFAKKAPVAASIALSPGAGYYTGSCPNGQCDFTAVTSPGAAAAYYVPADTYTTAWMESNNTSYWSVYSYSGSGSPGFSNYTAYCLFSIPAGGELVLSTYDLTYATTYYVKFIGQ